jgi:signal transduction histidine kinase
MDILLDNGMKYSSPSGTVDVCLRRYGNHALLTVATPGDQISREDLKNIFKRFYRVDKARSINGSYGLGLSIAQRIITEHRGKIWAESYRGINTFYVQLPLSRGTKQ